MIWATTYIVRITEHHLGWHFLWANALMHFIWERCNTKRTYPAPPNCLLLPFVRPKMHLGMRGVWYLCCLELAGFCLPHVWIRTNFSEELVFFRRTFANTSQLNCISLLFSESYSGKECLQSCSLSLCGVCYFFPGFPFHCSFFSQIFSSQPQYAKDFTCLLPHNEPFFYCSGHFFLLTASATVCCLLRKWLRKKTGNWIQRINKATTNAAMWFWKPCTWRWTKKTLRPASEKKLVSIQNVSKYLGRMK